MDNPQNQGSGGCYTCRFKLPEAHIQDSLNRFLRAGREAVVCQRFLAVEFSDGFDALFVTLVSQEEEGTKDAVAQVASEFERLDSRRTLVLNGLRRHLASHEIAHLEKAVGQWDTQSGSATSSIHVGPVLTRLVADNEPAEGLVRLVAANWLPTLAVEQALELVQATVPLPDPVRWKSEEEIQGLFGSGILALDCQALDGDGDLPSEPAALIDVLAPTRDAPGQVLVNRLVERLGRWRFSMLLGKGEALLEFSDKLDQYRIHPRSKKLAREITLTGADAALDRYAEEFLRLDHSRSQALRLLGSVMAHGGYSADEDGDCVWFGKTHRLAKFSHGRPLTLALRHHSPEKIIHEWLTHHHLIAPAPSEAELKALETASPAEPPQRWLPAEPPERWDRLPKLADLDAKDLDRRAAESIAQALEEAGKEPGRSRIGDTKDLLQLWVGPFWYRPGDGWASEEFWLSYAQAAWRESQHQFAAVLLARAGKCPEESDPEEQFRQQPIWYSEAFEDAFVWHFVELLPWAIDEGEYPKFPHRFRPRPPQVVRRAVRAFREAFAKFISATAKNDRWLWLSEALSALVDVDRESATVWLRPAELRELETHLRNWADEADFVGHDWDAAFVVAAEFNWHWLPAALSANPLFNPAQFHMENLYSAPGETALKLSWVEPCELAARFAAVALKEQSPAALEQRARTIAGGTDFYESGREIVRNSLTVDRFAAAIAWQRCRAKGVC